MNYSSPELAKGQKYFDGKADIWSLGCCLFYLATKKDPFYADSNERVKNNIFKGRIEHGKSKLDAKIKTIIDACIVSNPRNRPSANDLLFLIDNLMME